MIAEILELFREDTESYAECCSHGGTGKLEDMDADEDREYVTKRRKLYEDAMSDFLYG